MSLFDDVDILCINTLRTLAMDAVQAANSGHPGTPMALAPIAYLLASRTMHHDPADPTWPDRDRFVLSCGHASMLQYGMLHLSGYDLPLAELEAFRQWGSRTPGHPELGHVPGVEVTTGPLGQGIGASVGFAFAEEHLAAQLNRPGHRVIDHRTWVICSDGDLMEGLSSEAASLAGHLGLSKLTWIWDDNRITIEGDTDLATSEDVVGRLEAFGWHTQRVDDANDLEALTAAFDAAVAETSRPSFIAVRTHIAWGAPTKQDTSDAHGAPLGADEVAATKRAYGWPEDAHFLVPDAVRTRCAGIAERGAEAHADWQRRHEAWAAAFPELAREWQRRLERRLPDGWAAALPSWPADPKGPATRAASGKVLNAIADGLPELVGGAADLAPSTKTLIDGAGAVEAGSLGDRNLHFGIREHAMAAFLGGVSLHGGLRPFGATFMVFADYMRPSIRLAALMQQPVIYVFTHDSLWVGEDGPTHQPIEQLLSLRAIPGLVVVRPADANETAAAWRVALERVDGPTALILTRQGLPVFEGTEFDGVASGAYVLVDAPGQRPDVVLIATGSEVALAVAARDLLASDGIAARVVSMPSWELFDACSVERRAAVLPAGVPKLAVEAGVSRGWRDYVGDDGAIHGVDRFGASAPGKVVAAHYGFTADAVAQRARVLLGKG
jgi:transketolase